MSDQSASQQASSAAQSANKVSFGSYVQNINANGKTVEAVRDFVKTLYNVPDDAQAYVNHQKVGSDYVLKEGESLQFHRPAGDKGA